MSKKEPRTPFLNPHFAAAMLQFTAALKKTTAIEHSPGKGRAREAVLAAFFNERLPHRYKVCEGEVIDLNGCTSPQMDLLFYDRMQNFIPRDGARRRATPYERYTDPAKGALINLSLKATP